MTAPLPETIISRIRRRVFHAWFLVRRPMTLGARALVHRPSERSVFLIRHTYVPGWQLPGGGVEVGETFEEALRRELAEEGNFTLGQPAILRSLHFNRHASRRDHVAFYEVRDFHQTAAKLPDHEIAEAGFFSIDALPAGTTAATRRRIAEVYDGTPASPFW